MRPETPVACKRVQPFIERPPPVAPALFPTRARPMSNTTSSRTPPKLRQPLFEPVEPPLAARLTNRHPAARRKIPLHGIAAAPQLASYPLGSPAQSVQLHHRRHLLRCQHRLSPRMRSPW